MKLSPVSILDESYIYTLIKDSTIVFVFWKFSKYFLSMFEQEKFSRTIRLKLVDEYDNTIFEISQDYSKGGCYIVVPKSGIKLKVVMAVNENNVDKLLLVSNEFMMPHDIFNVVGVADEEG